MKRCKQIQADGFHHCGSYAFNLWKEDIDQGDLCDVHYWQNQAQAARKALAEQPAQQEPVGKVNELFDESVIKQCGFDRELLVYTTPQPAQRKPLTDDEILKTLRPTVWAHVDGASRNFMLADARAIEAAHGIKENT